MQLTDLKNAPTGIQVNLKITGPNGVLTAPAAVTVNCAVTDPNSSTVHQDPITLVQNAVRSGDAAVGAASVGSQLITVTANNNGNCYWLPWGSGKAFMGSLGAAAEYFFTYTINGCGVIVGGTTAQPIVVHANLDCPRLDAVVTDSIQQHGIANAGPHTAKGQALIYDQFYGNLAAKLIDMGLLSGNCIEIVTPQQYLVEAGAGFGAVFGIRKGGNWEFYGNWAGKTKKIWPR